MDEKELLKNWLQKNGHKLKMAYSYAVVNKLNITSHEDVLKMLKATDPENANEEGVRIYSKMLQLFANRFRKAIDKRLKDQ